MPLRCPRLAALVLATAAACGKAPAPDATKAAPPPAKVQNPKPETELTTVTLTPEAEAHLALKIEDVRLEVYAPTRTVGGEVTVPSGRSVVVTAPVAGVLGLPGGRPATVGPVTKGEAVFELVPIQQSDSDPAADAERAVRESDARLAEAAQRLARLEGLLREGSTSVRTVEEARANHAVAAAAAEAAKRKLATIRRLPIGSRGELSLVAPFDGVITALHAAAGQSVSAGAAVMDVVQIATVWIRVPVYAGELTTLDTSRLAAIAPLGRELSGPWREATRVAGPPTADPNAASVDLFFEVPNPAAALRPGERVSVRLPVKSATTEKAIVIPVSALIYDLSGGTWVYEVKAPHVYRRRRVEVAGQTGSSAIVRRGLTEGTRIVTVGAAELYGTEFFVSK